MNKLLATLGAVVVIGGGAGGFLVIHGSGGGSGACVSPCVMASSVTENGVQFTFSQAEPTGTFNNGDPYVFPDVGQSNVVVTAMTPAVISPGVTGTPSGSTATVRGQQNGWMVNPTGQTQTYDGLAGQFSTTGPPALPYTAVPGTSIIKTVALASALGCTPTCGANTTWIDKAVVLTVLGSQPPDDAFRPPFAGTVKTIWRQSDENTALLPSLASVTGAPSLVNAENRFKQVQLDMSYGTVAGRPLPAQSFHAFTSSTTPHVYGENITIDNGEGILRSFLNDTIAAKQNLINYLVQAGIDYYGVANAGITIANNGGGGHEGGRKLLVTYAGWLLGSTAIQNVASGTSGAGFGEPNQYYWSSLAGGPNSHFIGRGPGMALFGFSGGTGTFPFVGNATPTAWGGAKDRVDPLSLIDGGLDVSTSGGSQTANTALTGASYHNGYNDIASTNAMMAATIAGIAGTSFKTIFNDQTELNYGDRRFDFGYWSLPDNNAGRRYTNWTVVNSLHGLDNHASSMGAYGSGFMVNMHTYDTNDSFTGP